MSSAARTGQRYRKPEAGPRSLCRGRPAAWYWNLPSLPQHTAGRQHCGNRCRYSVRRMSYLSSAAVRKIQSPKRRSDPQSGHRDSFGITRHITRTCSDQNDDSSPKLAAIADLCSLRTVRAVSAAGIRQRRRDYGDADFPCARCPRSEVHHHTTVTHRGIGILCGRQLSWWRTSDRRPALCCQPDLGRA